MNDLESDVDDVDADGRTRPAQSSGAGGVVQAGGAEHGAADPVAFQAAVTEDFQPFVRAKACSPPAPLR
ncbi:hypothetical protein ACWC3X_42435 [Streptomyces populi]